ncbi:isoleucine-tRNA ligase [Collariella sp. IMI 366227]|nr:isoleucine-tRNA ligase [Collariella sp. IMI 366227]
MLSSWSSTLRLPKSTFLPRPRPQQGDQYIQKCADDFYKWQAINRPADNEFVLHDGPPYANGALHAGHALNKILKDMILRVKVQQGRRVSYIPGWDCHGLPIEIKAVGPTAGKRMSPGAIRKAARKLASKAVADQMKSFRSYAVMGDWDAHWTTMDLAYELRQLRLFQKLARRGLVYRKYKPVYWSPSSGTALAEAELEYNEKHVSKAAWVRFPVTAGNEKLPGMEGLKGRLYAVVWTTTPWTLPANQAIAVHENLTYCVIQIGDDAYLVAENCLESFANLRVGEGLGSQLLGAVKGSELTQLRYVNRLRGKSAKVQPFIHGSFVTDGSGSGLVHCAPGHGFDDYLACLSLGIPVSAPVDNDGLFTEDAFPDQPDRLKGIAVLGDGSSAVLDLLGDDVIKVHKYTHKYPYDWRTKKPIIIRATAQWFADVDSIKNDALAAIDKVRFVPEHGKNRLEAFIKGRSEWCISRQRAWGMPIPTLYEANGNAVMTDEVIDHIISVIQERGTDAWWNDAPDDLAWIPESLRGKGEYTRGQDTMDVWFDSGTSWTMLDKQADIYLEGSDQHRGWFQSSLLTRVAAMADPTAKPTTNTLGLSPFKTLITHGFTLDKDGKKMSKSLGNIISADQVMDGSLVPPLQFKRRAAAGAKPVKDAFGSDALRLWVASSDYTGDIVLGEPVLLNIHQSLLKYRNSIRMLLGSMHASARTAPLTTVDRIALLQLTDVMFAVGKHYDNFEFNKAISAINEWIVNDLSSFYLEAMKDRLRYFFGFLRMLAPITPVLVEEAWEHRPQWMKEDEGLEHPLRQLYTAPLVGAGRLNAAEQKQLREAMPILMTAHSVVKGATNIARVKKRIGSNLECEIMLRVPSGEVLSVLERFKDQLAGMFVVSNVRFNEALSDDEVEWDCRWGEVVEGQEIEAWAVPPTQVKCPRCWRYVAPQEDRLCGRCEEVVAESLR